MLAQAEGQAKADGIYKLGTLQNQIIAPHNGPKVVLDNLSRHAVWSSQGTNPNGSGTLLTLRQSLKELSEIIQRRRQDYLIVWAGRLLEHG
jgi:hypothetical protein